MNLLFFFISALGALNAAAAAHYFRTRMYELGAFNVFASVLILIVITLMACGVA
jgi:hypothetical protein